MGKTGDTKRKIIEMLEEKHETLTDISDKLGLAPSTVSQHLQELMDSGNIRLVEDRPRKWKYYEINKRDYIQNRPGNEKWTYIKRVGIPMAAVALALLFVYAFYAGKGVVNTAVAQQVYLAPGASVPSGSTLFTVSDAPTFYNISALVVTVQNVSIHSESNGKWYTIPLQANTFDLIQLKNISSIMSGVKLSNGIYDDIVLQISNVTATINGTNESVFLPSGRLMIVGTFNISNNTTSWINVDFDLAHSLHITGNGKIVMLPVVSVRHVDDSELNLNENSIVMARGPGKLKSVEEFGMDEHGNMMHNFSAQYNVSVEEGGRGILLAKGNGHIPIIIRTERSLFIGGDASGILNATGSDNEIIMGLSLNTQANATDNITETDHVVCCPMGRGMGMPCRMIKGTTCPEGIYRNNNASLNISASDLNNGVYSKWGDEMNVTLLNISVHSKGEGSFNADCTLHGGGLYCTSNQSENPNSIAVGIGQSIKGRLIARGIISSTGNGTGVNESVEGGTNNTSVGIIGKLVVRGGSCANLTMGEC